MIIPEVGKRINYRYFSSLVSMNIVLTVGESKYGCKHLTIEGPFIGKYFAIVYENDSEISLLAWGKGLYYGDLKKDNVENPLFSLDKSMELSGDMPLGERYIINKNQGNAALKIGNREYKDCIVVNVIYDKGKYVVCLKEGIGLILIQNIVNNIIKDEIQIQEA